LYAVVRTGGKQYRVEPGTALKVERLPGEVGDVIEIGDVLLMDGESGITVGAPTVVGARVLGTIAEQGRTKKIVVFRYKAKTRYRKKTGHRQHFTKIVVDDILLPGEEPKPKAVSEPAAIVDGEEPKRGRRKKAETAAAADAPATEARATEALSGAEPTPATEKPKRGRKKAV
jgi:large subunit ribosomal protein L21